MNAQARRVAPTVRRCKPGALFMIRISLTDFDEFTRQDLIDSLSEDLASFCVAIERSEDKQVSWHMHAFLEFKEKIFVNDLRLMLASMYDECNLDVQPCRSKKSCLIYISKEDRDLLTNVKVSSLNFNYQAYRWACRVPYFDHADPFVMTHRHCYKFLEKMFESIKFKINNEFVCFNDQYSCYHNWTMSVCMWWNEWHSKFSVKRPCLYLYGPSNTGKSSFIERIIGAKNMPYVYYPDVGKFFMQSFNIDYHRLILFEEFDSQFAVTSMLKRLLEGRSYAYPVKCGVSKVIVFKGPIIFVSNFENLNDQALRNRMYFVSANEAFWKAPLATVPKEEENKENQGDIQELSE